MQINDKEYIYCSDVLKTMFRTILKELIFKKNGLSLSKKNKVFGIYIQLIFQQQISKNFTKRLSIINADKLHVIVSCVTGNQK